MEKTLDDNQKFFELCKELEQLSGWSEGTSPLKEVWVERESGQGMARILRDVDTLNDTYYPRYSLEFLITNMPVNTTLIHAYDDEEQRNEYIAEGKFEPTYKHYGRIAKSPRIAMCSLAVALFKHGILTKGQ